MLRSIRYGCAERASNSLRFSSLRRPRVLFQYKRKIAQRLMERPVTIQKELDLVVPLSDFHLIWLPFLAIMDRFLPFRICRARISHRKNAFLFFKKTPFSSKKTSFARERGGSGMRETGLESFESTDARGRARVPERWTLPVSRNSHEGGTRTGAAMTH